MQYSKIILSQIGCQHAVNRYFVFTLRMSQFLNLIQQFAPVGESRSRIGNFLVESRILIFGIQNTA